MKSKLLVGIVIGALVIAGGYVAFSAYQVRQSGDEQSRKAEVLTASRAVDDKFTEVWDRLANRDQMWAKAVQEPTSSLATMLDLSGDDIEQLQTDVKDARALIEKIPSEDVQAKYTAVCDALDTAFEGALDDAEEAKPLSDAYQLMYKAAENDRIGWNSLNDSISSCNNEKWNDAKQQAADALTNYQAMRDAYTQAAALSGVGSVETCYQYIDAAISLVNLQSELATLGSKGSINKYNAQITKLNDQQSVIDALKSLPGNAQIAVWEKAENTYGHFEARATKAKNLWDDARELVSSGDV